MQTILGANGKIATELARELKARYTDNLRLVSRNPRKVNATDELVSANLLDAAQTLAAVQGSEIVYSRSACRPIPKCGNSSSPSCSKTRWTPRAAGAKFVYFDNTYMYPQTAQLQTEDIRFAPWGGKWRVRSAMAEMVLQEMKRGEMAVLIARIPEFYGPGNTQSITNTLVIGPIKQGQKKSKSPYGMTALEP